MSISTAERVTHGAEIEGEIREFVRKEPIHRAPTEASESAVSNVNSLVQRVAGASLQELDNLIVELQNLRDFLLSEGERIQREIAGYGELSTATLRSSKIITDSLPSWKAITDGSRRD